MFKSNAILYGRCTPWPYLVGDTKSWELQPTKFKFIEHPRFLTFAVTDERPTRLYTQDKLAILEAFIAENPPTTDDERADVVQALYDGTLVPTEKKLRNRIAELEHTVKVLTDSNKELGKTIQANAEEHKRTSALQDSVVEQLREEIAGRIDSAYSQRCKIDAAHAIVAGLTEEIKREREQHKSTLATLAYIEEQLGTAHGRNFAVQKLNSELRHENNTLRLANIRLSESLVGKIKHKFFGKKNPCKQINLVSDPLA